MKIKISELKRVISEASSGGFWTAVEDVQYEGASGVYLYRTQAEAQQHVTEQQNKNKDDEYPDDYVSFHVHGPFTFGDNLLSKRLESDDDEFLPPKKKL